MKKPPKKVDLSLCLSVREARAHLVDVIGLVVAEVAVKASGGEPEMRFYFEVEDILRLLVDGVPEFLVRRCERMLEGAERRYRGSEGLALYFEWARRANGRRGYRLRDRDGNTKA